MADKITTSYLDQAMDVLQRVTPMRPAQLRALGFLRSRLNGKAVSGPVAGRGKAGGLAAPQATRDASDRIESQ